MKEVDYFDYEEPLKFISNMALVIRGNDPKPVAELLERYVSAQRNMKLSISGVGILMRLGYWFIHLSGCLAQVGTAPFSNRKNVE